MYLNLINTIIKPASYNLVTAAKKTRLEERIGYKKISGAELNQEIAKGKSVVKIAKTQVERHYKAEQTGATISTHLMEQMMKEIEPKVLKIIEHKTGTEW